MYCHRGVYGRRKRRTHDLLLGNECIIWEEKIKQMDLVIKDDRADKATRTSAPIMKNFPDQGSHHHGTGCSRGDI